MRSPSGREQSTESRQRDHEDRHTCFYLLPKDCPDAEVQIVDSSYAYEGNDDHTRGKAEEEADTDFLRES